MSSIKVLTPTCTLGYGFSQAALERGMAWGPDVIAVDAGSTDPGPHYLGSGERLVSDFSIKRELKQLLRASRRRGIPLIIGSAGGAGSKPHVDATVAVLRDAAREEGISVKVAWIYSDIDPEVAAQAAERGDVRDFEAGYELKPETVRASCALVAQMGHEPIVQALEGGADVIIAGRACDDSVIAAFPIWKGADPGLAIHMGKILECGAFSAEPHGADVMLGAIDRSGFELEPGAEHRRASLISVAAHTLYEREDPFMQSGPGHHLDLSDCEFVQKSERVVRVTGSRFSIDDDYWIKLEGARVVGMRSISIAGIRCPTMIAQIDDILADAKGKALDYFSGHELLIDFHVYGRDGVMRELEPERTLQAKELGLVIDVVADTQDLARSTAHFISGHLLHCSFEGQFNTAGNLAFPYSPSEIDVGPVFEYSAYHLMRTTSPDAHFKAHFEDLCNG